MYIVLFIVFKNTLQTFLHHHYGGWVWIGSAVEVSGGAVRLSCGGVVRLSCGGEWGLGSGNRKRPSWTQL